MESILISQVFLDFHHNILVARGFFLVFHDNILISVVF